MGERDILERNNVWVAGERPWQRRLRLVQALWREEHGWPAARVRSRQGSYLLESRLPAAEATAQGWNFITAASFERAAKEVTDNKSRSSQERKVLQTPRLFNDLLSSQPLCFNLFAELDRDRRLAARTFSHLWPERVVDVTRIEFEWSPGRADAKYLENRSAFDVVIEHTTPDGTPGVIGVEVKYNENLRTKAGDLRPRAREVAERAHLGVDLREDRWHRGPLNQLLLDHLLALSMELTGAWSSVQFVLLFPAANRCCYQASGLYLDTVQRADTFRPLTMEELVAVVLLYTGADWPRQFYRRCLELHRTAQAGLPSIRSRG